jgi:hypothetical protein
MAFFWAYDALPFMDLPAHAGLIALRQRFASSPFEQQYYVLAPHLGAYSLFRGLGDLLSRALGPVGAVRMLATVSVLGLPASILFARWRLHGDLSPSFGFMGLTLGLGLMTLFGFATFMLGVVVFVVCMACWLAVLGSALDGAPWASGARRRELLAVAATTALLFVTHGFAFVIFLGNAAVTWFAAATGRAGPLRPASVRAAALLAPPLALAPGVALAGCAAWTERSTYLPPGSMPPPGPRGLPLQFQPVLDKLSLLATPTLMTRTGLDLLVGGAVWTIAIASIVAATAWLRRARPAVADPGERRSAFYTSGLLACQVLVLAAFAVLPHEIGWFGFVDGRLIVVSLALALLCLPPQAIGRRLAFAYDRAMPPLCGLVVALALVASRRFQDEARGYDDVLSTVPRFARLLNLPVDPDSDVFTGHPFIHYDKLVLADRPVLVSDLWFHQGSGVYPREGNPVLRLPPEYLPSNLRGVDWDRFPLDDWDYVLLRTRPSRPPPATPPALRLAKHVGGWWLYTTGRQAGSALTNR